MYRKANSVRSSLKDLMGSLNKMKSKGSAGSDGRIHYTRELLSHSDRLSPHSPVYKIDEKIVVKFGDVVRMAEAAAMRLVREKTSIPVPEVFDAYIQDEGKNGVIVMEYIDGKPLDKEWNSYTKAQKDNIISQLKGYVDELRTISGTYVGSVDGTYCGDQFFSSNPTVYGPFSSEAEFHNGLVQALRDQEGGTWTDMVVRFIEALPPHKIILTHNDLAPRNILVRDGKVVAIIDWELSGYYPEYWEYVKAMLWPDWQSGWIEDGVVDKILCPYILELAYLLHAHGIF
ncbi:MAG: hypothetical protein M1839_002165 [Geoglossum umbratile]|nr:MAG: hypothetical protein M1839_002165 [Geoglossum umbratile]